MRNIMVYCLFVEIGRYV